MVADSGAIRKYRERTLAFIPAFGRKSTSPPDKKISPWETAHTSITAMLSTRTWGMNIGTVTVMLTTTLEEHPQRTSRSPTQYAA